MVRDNITGSRRSFLKVAGTAAAAGMTGLAGCTGSDSGDGGGSDGNAGGADASTPTPTLTTEKTTEKDALVIGQYGALSGPVAGSGTDNVAAGDIAIEQINAMGGMNGHPVESVTADSEASPDTGVQRSRQMIQQDGVDVIVGGSTSAVAKAISQFVAQQDGVIYISAGPQTPDITGPECQRTTFRITENLVHGQRAAAALIDDITPSDATKIAGINPDYVFGHQSWEVFVESMGERRSGIEAVSETWPAFLKGEYQKEIQQTLDADPDIVHTVLFSGDLISFIKQANQFDFFDQIDHFYAGITPMQVAPSLGDEFPDGAYMTAEAYMEWPEAVGGTPDRVSSFVEEFRDRNDRVPGITAFSQHSAIFGIKKAIEKTGGITADDLIEGLEGLEWEGVAPPEYIRPGDHQTIRDFFLGGQMGPLPDEEFMGFTDLRAFPSEEWADEDTCEKF